MASGIQDWWRRGSIDIIAQTLAETYSRPTYGAFVSATDTSVVPVSTLEKVIDISGTGQIYGGYMRMSTLAAPTEIIPEIRIDGHMVVSGAISYMDQYNLEVNRTGMFFVLLNDDPGNSFCVGISSPITFESSVELYMWNVSAAQTITTVSWLFYALV